MSLCSFLNEPERNSDVSKSNNKRTINLAGRYNWEFKLFIVKSKVLISSFLLTGIGFLRNQKLCSSSISIMAFINSLPLIACRMTWRNELFFTILDMVANVVK